MPTWIPALLIGLTTGSAALWLREMGWSNAVAVAAGAQRAAHVAVVVAVVGVAIALTARGGQQVER